jgi:NADH:ubiquinone reductase (non-electrogenic)
VGYGIYQGKHPVEQHAPDPNKKTLVVLGMGASPYPRNFEQH